MQYGAYGFPDIMRPNDVDDVTLMNVQYAAKTFHQNTATFIA